MVTIADNRALPRVTHVKNVPNNALSCVRQLETYNFISTWVGTKYQTTTKLCYSILRTVSRLENQISSSVSIASLIPGDLYLTYFGLRILMLCFYLLQNRLPWKSLERLNQDHYTEKKSWCIKGNLVFFIVLGKLSLNIKQTREVWVRCMNRFKKTFWLCNLFKGKKHLNLVYRFWRKSSPSPNYRTIRNQRTSWFG